MILSNGNKSALPALAACLSGSETLTINIDDGISAGPELKHYRRRREAESGTKRVISNGQQSKYYPKTGKQKQDHKSVA